MRTRKADARSRILETALELFNRCGSHAVTTNHIAEAAEISVGNLYYHFKNKEEIVLALYDQIAEAWNATFTLPEDRFPDVEDLERMMRGNFEVLWHYRFFYRELIALLQRDAELKRRFQEVRQRGFRDFVELFRAFVAGGVFRPVDDADTLQQLAETCWMISEFWLPFLEMSNEEITSTHFERGVALLRHALHPYLTTAHLTTAPRA